MNAVSVADAEEAARAITVYVPEDSTVYALDDAARLAQTSRHLVMVAYKHGLIDARQDPLFGGYYFEARTIRRLHRIAYLHEQCGINLTGVRLILELAEEIARARHPERT